MSTQISTAFVKQYEGVVRLLQQQMSTKLRRAVIEGSITGKEAYFEYIGQVTANKITTRHSDTQISETPHSRRMVTPAMYAWADLIDKADRLQMLIDPTSEYSRNAVAAFNREIDNIILTAALGTAYSGEAGTTAVALPAAQKIAHGSAGLTLQKILDAKLILDQAEFPEDEPRYFVTNAAGLQDLLGLSQITSSDHNTVKALVAGQVSSFLGFEWIISERLVMDSTAASRLNVAFVRQAMRLGVSSEIETRISERADKNYSTQVFLSMAMGATRVIEKGVVQVSVVE